MRSVLPLLFIAIISLGSFQTAFACSCVFEPGKRSSAEINTAIAKEFNESASVFSGEVVALDILTVKFRVITMWKGDALEEFTMSTGTVKLGEDLYRSSSCDYSFKVGEKYLVYARWAENNQLIALSCTRTRVLSNELPDLNELQILNPDAYRAPARPQLSRLDRTLGRRRYA
ncbi:MAG TPA: hypothetical protein DC047_05955 [Blastocatellia bacterium]|nr:hypothetical protein [Blastocatellia bacterium]